MSSVTDMRKGNQLEDKVITLRAFYCHDRWAWVLTMDHPQLCVFFVSKREMDPQLLGSRNFKEKSASTV